MVVSKRNFAYSKNKFGYVDAQTLIRLAEKSMITQSFLQGKTDEYEWHNN
jgi:hypothetical protein